MGTRIISEPHEAIRVARAAIDDAVARRDAGAIGARIVHDYTVVTPRSVQHNGRDANTQRWIETFERDEDRRHVWTIDAIIASAEWGMAEERGKWTMTPQQLAGRYSAKWGLTVGGWLLRAEIDTASPIATAKAPMVIEHHRDAIVVARSAINDAIARRDSDAIAARLTHDYSVVTVRNLQRNGREESARSWSNMFKHDHRFTHTSAADEIHVDDAWGMAEEHGTWTSTTWTPDGVLELKGVYTAKWHLTPSGWLLRAEIFTPMTTVQIEKPEMDRYAL